MTENAVFPLPGLRFAQEPAARDAHAEEVNLSEILGHHILDSHYYELPFIGEVHLPSFPPVLGVDMSITKHTVLLLAAAGIVFMLALLASRTLARIGPEKAPTGFANAFEAVVIFVRDEICKNNIGQGYRPFVPFILTLFFFILTMNLMGLVPWGGSASGNLAVTATLAIITLVVTEVSGLVKLGFRGYMGTIFFAPPGVSGVGKWAMMAFMTPIEVMTKFTKPLALCFRLFGNMTAGHLIIFALLGMILLFASSPEYVRWGVAGSSAMLVTALMMLELLIAVVQAYVFAILSAVFIGLMQHEH